MRTLGTVVRGVRAPIFRQGDDAVAVTVETVLNALRENGIEAHDKDVVAITESVVARCQGNYATVEQISADVRAKTGGETVGVTFPILSRNRFSLLLQGIAGGCQKVVLMLSYPSDEVGNHLVSMDQLDEAGIDPWHDVLDLKRFRDAFGTVIHPFTGVDYVDYYKSIIESAGAQAEIIFANRVQTVLNYTDTVICCDIHTRARSKRLLKAAGAKTVKLKFGHRGANQPVRELKTGRVYITSQNHGYAVDGDTLPDFARLSYVNANDGTCEGVDYPEHRAFSMQFHPEACAGPLDMEFAFDHFTDMMEGK